ncbi:hypothetical protein QSI_3592 [Clostridioides difficile P28]|nr:hypothetical protein QSI_3592 [Clostridioides difficile P28]
MFIKTQQKELLFNKFVNNSSCMFIIRFLWQKNENHAVCTQ